MRINQVVSCYLQQLLFLLVDPFLRILLGHALAGETFFALSLHPKKRHKRNMGNLPQDPMILLSYVNTELRDNCASLDDFCHLHNVDKAALMSKLKAAGFEYNAELKKFW